MANIDTLRAIAQGDLSALLKKLGPRHRGMILSAVRQYGSVAAIPVAFWQELQRDIDEEAAAAILLLIVAGYEDTEDELGVDRLGRHLVMPAASTTAAVQAQRMSTDWVGGLRQRLIDSIDSNIFTLNDLSDVERARELRSAIRDATSDDRAETAGSDAATRGATSARRSGRDDVQVRTKTKIELYWENHPEDSESGPCDKCAPYHNTPESTWGQVYPEGPPQPHKRCVCKLRVVVIVAPEGESEN